MLKDALKSLYSVLAITVLVLGVVIGIAFFNLYQLGRYTDQVAHTSAVLGKAEEVFAVLKDAETGQRGYLVTNDDDYLDLYFDASRRIDPLLRSLDSLTFEDSHQALNMDTLWHLSNSHFYVLDRSLHLYRRTAGAIDSTLHASMDEGRRNMNDIQALIRDIKSTELRVLKEREKQKAQMLRQLPVILGLLSVLALVVFGVTFFFVIRQVRQRFSKEQELEKTVAKLRRLNEELENFTFVASHHLQEPLRKIRLYADRLTRKHAGEFTTDGQHTINRMGDSAEQIQVLIDDLLTFTQFAEYAEQFPFEQVSVQKAVRAAVRDLREEIDAAEAEVKLQGEFPMIWGNETQLEQLFSHLIGNGLKFRKPKEPPHITIAAQSVDGRQLKLAGLRKSDREKRFCQITCTDNGIGFEEQSYEKIFRLFQRLHHKSEYPGTGVGLAICKKVVTNHDGYIDVKSMPGKGSTFTVYLPITSHHSKV